jgi:hypothetical protein
MSGEFNERHRRAGLMTNQPPHLPMNWDQPHASTIVCDRPECQKKARFWVQGTTGEAATYYADADRGL